LVSLLYYIRRSFKKFPEIAGIIHRNCYTREISVHWHPSSTYGCGQKETLRKRDNKL